MPESMDTFSLAFTNGAWWVYLLIVAAAATVAIITYRNVVPDPGRGRRVVLITLRTIALAALLLALFEPVLRFVRSDVVPPRVALLVDRSASAGMRDARGDRAPRMRAAVRRVLNRMGDDADVAVFDGSVSHIATPAALDTLALDGRRTDLGLALRWAANGAVARGSQAVIVITDGNTNAGDDPVSIAERSGLPVLAVGVGDTVPPSDAALASIFVPPLAIVGEQASVSVDLSATGMQGATLDVGLYDDGREIGRQRVDVRDRRQTQTLQFAVTPSAEGVRKLTARIMPTQGEFTDRNNVVSDFLQVRSKKRTVVLVAGAPSPDVAFVRDALASDPAVSVAAFMQRQGSTYYGTVPTRASFTDAVAIVTVGFPNASTPPDVVAMVAEAVKGGRSLFWIASADVDYAKLGPLAEYLPFRVMASRPREFPVTADVTPSAVADPIMRVDGSSADVDRWNDLPPLYRTETFIEPHPNATVLATQRLNGVPMGDPLIMARDIGERRVLAIMGHGIYRWKLLGHGPGEARGVSSPDVLTSFVDNGMRWLSANADRRRVRIRPSRTTYATGEPVQFLATVLDAADVPLDDADVRVNIVGSGTTKEIILAPLGNGRYATVVGTMPPGDYAFRGVARSGGTSLGVDEGRFNVGDVNVEYLGTTMNAAMLRRLADVTGGRFTTPDGLDAALEALVTDPRFAARTVTTSRDIALWSSWWLLALAVAAFATEWFLRKRSGLV